MRDGDRPDVHPGERYGYHDRRDGGTHVDHGSALTMVGPTDLERVRQELRRNAQVFERPAAYIAGVEDALSAIASLARHGRIEEPVRVHEIGSPRMI